MSGTKDILYDPEDALLVERYKWHVSSTGYAVWRGVEDGIKRTVRMHRLINNTPKGFDTDHINGNKLDNRRSNLRTVTRSQNMLNVNRASVCFDKSRNKWLARIGTKYIGRFKTKEEAVKAYELKVGEAF